MALVQDELIQEALSKNPDMESVLNAAIKLFDSRIPDSRNFTQVSAHHLSELFLALKLDELAGYVTQERPEYVAGHGTH